MNKFTKFDQFLENVLGKDKNIVKVDFILIMRNNNKYIEIMKFPKYYSSEENIKYYFQAWTRQMYSIHNLYNLGSPSVEVFKIVK